MSHRIEIFPNYQIFLNYNIGNSVRLDVGMHVACSPISVLLAHYDSNVNGA